MKTNKKARVIAFYLPQYHPIPENDKWWGKGFTEWMNVVGAKPLFPSHCQPKLPGELGFYDLRVPETREAQAELAQDHGIEGFCYWHYWLGGGKRLLQRPFDEVLETGKPGLPFCLAWANHSWTRAWFGAQDRILVEQTYPGKEDYKKHFDFLLKAFADPRYIKVNEKPLFYIYRVKDIPNIVQMLDDWREAALRAGFKGLHIVGENVDRDELERYGLDANAYTKHRGIQRKYRRKLRRLYRYFRRFSLYLRLPEVYFYANAMKYFLKSESSPINEYPSLVPGWDNTPRLGASGLVYINNTPALFQEHARQAIDSVIHKPLQNRILFVKSWNEWAEGNYLEPDALYGRMYLQAIKNEVFA